MRQYQNVFSSVSLYTQIVSPNILAICLSPSAELDPWELDACIPSQQIAKKDHDLRWWYRKITNKKSARHRQKRDKTPFHNTLCILNLFTNKYQLLIDTVCVQAYMYTTGAQKDSLSPPKIWSWGLCKRSLCRIGVKIMALTTCLTLIH